MNIERLKKTLNEINQIGCSDKGITRLAYTEEEKQATDHFISLCKKEGLLVRIDECGNVIARREGANPELPVVAMGSHLDTVKSGGKFDGTLGVISGLEVIRTLNEKEIETQHPIELISFACEESARFGVSTIGSKAMTGSLNKDKIENLKDGKGISISNAFSSKGLEFSKVGQSKREQKEFKAFFELHVEQGPILEKENKKIGIVTGIASPTRLEVVVKGKQSHSGTTPMNNRKDALLGAAEISLELEKAAKKEADKGTVATVGVLDVKESAMNVVPGEVMIKIDIRSTSIESKQKVLEEIKQSFNRIANKRWLTIDWKVLGDELPVLLDEQIVKDLSELCEHLAISYIHMPSGAGHDAMNMATICPTGLIFVPSAEGLSHHPDEYTSIEDIGVGVQLLEEIILKYAVSRTS
ncbi:M20 family metallo-hydrolase [Mesobacillus harenae]|uniref:M20 family metallo-hydrolase n=1 Tax=Mesobacillus harenae TaxID=2213203 RepID=UPI0015810F07|nr:M20 family metallo-hydrolase [Mesobacillus harenae]